MTPCRKVIGSGVDEASRLHLSDPTGRLIRSLPVGANQQLLEMDLKRAEYSSALNSYYATIDQGDTPDLIAYLQSQPLQPSYTVRDQLLAHHPLSDEVLLELLKRVSEMAPWHTTQVLIDNSPLKNAIWDVLKDPEVLSDYFYNMLKQYDQGLSAKDMLESEVAMRSVDKSRAYHKAIWSIDADSTMLGKVDTLASILLEDLPNGGIRDLYWLYLLNDRRSDASTLEAAMYGDPAGENLMQLGQRLDAAGGRWEALTEQDRDALELNATYMEAGVGAVSWAALLALNEWDSLPHRELPAVTKALHRLNERARSEETEPLLAAYPNPARDLVRITIGQEVKAGLLEVFDAQGRSVLARNLQGQRAFVELDLSNAAPGLYLARISRDGFALGETKFSVLE